MHAPWPDFHVTGGTGYLGCHVCVELISAGHEVVALDSLSNSRNDVLGRIESIAGRRPRFLSLDVRREALLRAALRPYAFDGVVHLAAVTCAQEPVHSAEFYRTNVAGTANILEATGGCAFVLASSAAVYGHDAHCPIAESAPLAPATPFARSKLAAESLVRDAVAARGGAACLLRCFNVAGAHESGWLGDDPRAAPASLATRSEQVAVGVRDRLVVHGCDHPTPDRTAVQDYVHVMDVARAHRLALERLAGREGVVAYNVGSGRGRSVLEVIDAFARAAGRPLAYRFEPRRAGETSQRWADASLAREQLGWVAQRGIDDIAIDALRWRGFWLDRLRPPLAEHRLGAAPPASPRKRSAARRRHWRRSGAAL